MLLKEEASPRSQSVPKLRQIKKLAEVKASNAAQIAGIIDPQRDPGEPLSCAEMLAVGPTFLRPLRRAQIVPPDGQTLPLRALRLYFS